MLLKDPSPFLFFEIFEKISKDWKVVASKSPCQVWLFGTSWTAAHQAPLFSSISWSLLKLMPVQSLMPSNHIILCPSISSCPQSFPASGSFPVSQFFASGCQSIGLSASASSPSNAYSELIFFRMDWFDLLAVQGTLKSLLQHYSSKVSLLQHSALFIVQLSHPYMTTGKTIALIIQTIVSKVIRFEMKTFNC